MHGRPQAPQGVQGLVFPATLPTYPRCKTAPNENTEEFCCPAGAVAAIAIVTATATVTTTVTATVTTIATITIINSRKPYDDQALLDLHTGS